MNIYRAGFVLLLFYFLLLFFFPNVSWGVVDLASDANFYNRGTGHLFFSLINIFLFFLFVLCFVFFGNNKQIGCDDQKIPINGFLVILVGNVFLWFVVDNVPAEDFIGYKGMVNVFNFMILVFVFLRIVDNSRWLRDFLDFLILCAVIRGAYGLIRYFVSGGDPANFYANFQQIDVTITFFDINDSLVAVLAIFVVGWRLLNDKISCFEVRVFYIFLILLELFVVLFSYRRTAWLGLIVVALFFALLQSKVNRNRLLAVFFMIGLPVFFIKFGERAGDFSSDAPILERFFPDLFVYGVFDITQGRFVELYAAILSLWDSPIFGLGFWGRYDGDLFPELFWHEGDFSWMHSGILHIVLKTGIFGGGLVVFSIFKLVQRFLSMRREMAPHEFSVRAVGFAGLFFMLPNWIVGTPVIEYRTMQLMAMCFAFVYVANGVRR